MLKSTNVLKSIVYLYQQKQIENMKAITLIKGQKVNTTDTQDLQNGITAFQIVKFVINYFGTEIETVHDTKIMKDGRQIVIGGCGYINEGYEL